MTPSRSRSFVAWTLLVVGVLMAAQWLGFLATGSVPELQTEPVAIGFHLAAEAVTAVLLMVAMFGVLLVVAIASAAALIGADAGRPAGGGRAP